jgi:hypothetical protein
VSLWRLLLIAIVIIDGAAWGGLYTVAKAVIDRGAHPLGVAVYEGLGAGIFLLSICLVTGRRLPVAPGSALLLINGISASAFRRWRSSCDGASACRHHHPVLRLVPVMTYGFALAAGMEGVDAMRWAALSAASGHADRVAGRQPAQCGGGDGC